jgi:UDP-GlcNAc:undecaprenyl-phosphate GlcNAc-1-phosphate transferase
MIEIGFSLAAFLSALVLSVLLTPLARRAAMTANLIAPVRPDRLHRETQPYGGGLALMAVLVLVMLLIQLTNKMAFDFFFYGRFEGTWIEVLLGPLANFVLAMGHWGFFDLGLGAIMFFIIGLIDDRFALSAWPKLALQTLSAAIVVVGFGVKATAWLAFPGAPELMSILWFLAVVNAYNMLDHADGLAGATGLIALLSLAAGTLATRCWYFGGPALFIAGVALVTAGALAGFLFFNFPPAKLFMGDAGSMLVGYLLAVLTIAARYYSAEHGTSKLVVLIPLAILAVPLFDMVCVTLSRIGRRQSPFRGDATSHLAHRMLARGWSPRGIVAFAAGASAVCGGASVAMYFLSGPALLLPWLAVAAVLAAMLLVRRPVRPEATS